MYMQLTIITILYIIIVHFSQLTSVLLEIASYEIIVSLLYPQSVKLDICIEEYIDHF